MMAGWVVRQGHRPTECIRERMRREELHPGVGTATFGKYYCKWGSNADLQPNKYTESRGLFLKKKKKNWLPQVFVAALGIFFCFFFFLQLWRVGSSSLTRNGALALVTGCPGKFQDLF